jgi:hypothetical protein
MSRKPIHEVATRKVKAVQRRAPASQLLPGPLLSASRVDFVERRQLGFTGSDYDVSLPGAGVVLNAESRLHVFRGWRYDFVTGDTVWFSMQRKTRLLLLDGLRVLDREGRLLGEFVQRPTAFSVHFDVLGADGAQRLTVEQPEDRWLRFDIFGPRGLLAVVTRDGPSDDSSTSLDRFFEVTFDAPTSEVDRALILSAAVFLDRLYFSDRDNTGT